MKGKAQLIPHHMTEHTYHMPKTLSLLLVSIVLKILPMGILEAQIEDKEHKLIILLLLFLTSCIIFRLLRARGPASDFETFGANIGMFRAFAEKQ